VDKTYVPDADGEQEEAGDAMHPAAQGFARSHHPRQPGVRKLEGESGDGKEDEAGRQKEVLPALREAHAHHELRLGAMPGRRLLQKQQEVVDEHGADRGENQDEVDSAHIPVDAAREVRAALLRSDFNVDLPERKLLTGARMTFPARVDQVGPVDGGVRIG
jgi:hypothetical protein